MTMSSIFQETIRENEIETADKLLKIFSMSTLLLEDETQKVGKNYGKYPLSDYKATSDPDTLYHHQDMKSYDSKEFLLYMIEEVADQINNGNLSLIRREVMP